MINYATRTWSLKRNLKKTLRNIQNEDVTLICFNIYFPVISSMVYAKQKNKNVNLCAVIGDLPGEYGAKSTLSGIKEIIARKIGSRADKLVKRSDAYGFLTKYMASAMEVTEKPFVVIEGMYSESSESVKVTLDVKDKMIFYAGAISKEYGILHLFRAFSLINGMNTVLFLPEDQTVTL